MLVIGGGKGPLGWAIIKIIRGGLLWRSLAEE
jgi:hypothetical protein